MIDKGRQCVLADEVGNNVARVFHGVRCPRRCNMLMLKLLRFPHIFREAAPEIFASFLINKRPLPPHVDIVWSSWKVNSAPALQTHSWWQCTDMLHRNVFIRTIIDV